MLGPTFGPLLGSVWPGTGLLRSPTRSSRALNEGMRPADVRAVLGGSVQEDREPRRGLCVARTQRCVLVLPVRRSSAGVPGVLHRREVGEPWVVPGYRRGAMKSVPERVPFEWPRRRSCRRPRALPTAAAPDRSGNHQIQGRPSRLLASGRGPGGPTSRSTWGRRRGGPAERPGSGRFALRRSRSGCCLRRSATVCMRMRVNVTSLVRSARSCCGCGRGANCRRPGLPDTHRVLSLRADFSGGAAELGRGGRGRVAHHGAVWNGRFVPDVEPVSRRRQECQRLGGEHGYHTGGPGRDRRHRRQDLHHQLRRRRRDGHACRPTT